jgi:Ca2+-binding RTX toxin-like protein
LVHSLAALTPRDEQGTLRLRLGEQDEVRIAHWRDGGVESLRFGLNGVLDGAHLLQPELAGVAARVSAAGAAGSAGDDALTLTLASGQVSAGAGNDRYVLTAGVRVEITDPDTANTLVFPDGASPAGLRLSGSAERWQIALDSTVVTTAPDTFQRYVFGGGLVLTGAQLKTLALAQIPLAPAVVEQIPNRGLVAGARFEFDLPANAFVDPNPRSFLHYEASLANGDPLPAWLQFSTYSGQFYGLAPGGLQLSLNVKISAEDPTGLRGAQTFGLDVMPPFKQGASAVLSCYALNARSGTWLQAPGLPFGAAPPPRVTALGDLNVDGLDDLLIGERIVWGNRRGLGETLALNALPLGASTRLLLLPDRASDALVSACADLNGDGRQDLLLQGADGEARVLLAQAGVWPAALAVDALPTVSGASAVSGPITPLDTPSLRWDFNGDGWADAPLESVNDRGLTELAIDLGGPRPARLTLDGAPYGFTVGTPLSDALARSAWGELRALGDVNGDGLGDLGLGSAPYLYENGNAYGAVIFGRREGALPRLTELNGSNGFLLAFPAPETGYAKRHVISGVGDVNGDGYADMLGSDDATGASFLLYGRSAFGGALEIGTAADDFIAVAQSCTVQAGGGDDHIKVSGNGQFAVYPGSGHNTVEIAPAAGGRINLVSESGGDIYQLQNSADATIYISNNGDLGGRLALPPGVSTSSVRLGQGSVLIDTGTGLKIHLEDVDFNDVLGGPRTLDVISFADGTVWRYEDLIARGFDLEGSAQADTLRGSNVVDRIVAGAGNDVLEGLAGEDLLDGGAGDDIYTFNPGSGVDSLRDASGRDVLRYPALSGAEALSFSHEGRDLLISQASGEQLRILDWDAALAARIELLICGEQAPLDLPALVNRAPVTDQTSIAVSAMTGERLDLQLPRDAFRDPDALDTLHWQLSAESGQWPAGLGFDPQTLRLSGTPSAPGSYPLLLSATDDFGATATLTCALSIQSRPVLRGSDRDDELQGSAGPDVLYGLAGNDRLWGLAGNDRLFGGAGSDALFGAAGNDLLDGGPGADRLVGGAGNDRYVFARGSGSDHIVNGDIAGMDEIFFTQCRPRDLSFHRQGTALEITRRGSGDRVHLPHWFDSPAARVDHIRLDDGHDLRAADVAVLVQAMARFEPASGAARPLSTANALAMEPVLAAVWH